ncbi:hypothetical protein TKK_0008989 [Trichogramma kaykai]|uniref:Inositol-pentakisphosphate 2-kinase n=1 Tax=Trichogramma kaykai TaxID=54128 RepID=A0ABD2X4A8_9HYME
MNGTFWIESCTYRGEGNANLIVASSKERSVIRLKKSATVNETDDLESAEKRLRQEVNFIKGTVTGFLGFYVDVPEIILCSEVEIRRLAQKIRSFRPENRLEKDIIGGYATKYPDYTFLSHHLSIAKTKPTYCVEIKPKQGYIYNIENQLPKCQYCLMQYYKVEKRNIDSPSQYCPFDLFSGEELRMKKALESLMNAPQNNFRLFRGGELIKDMKETSTEKLLSNFLSNEDDSKMLLIKIMIEALTRPFDSNSNPPKRRSMNFDGIQVARSIDVNLLNKARSLLQRLNQKCQMKEISQEGLIKKGSVLERIYKMQQLHDCPSDVIIVIYNEFILFFGTNAEELIHEDLADLCIIYASTDDIFRSRKKRLEKWIVNQKSSIGSSDKFKQISNNEPLNVNQILEKSIIGSLSVNDCFDVLGNYLLFSLARDCSIMMTFQELDKESLEHIDPLHIITASESKTFVFDVKVLDLDLKSLSCVEKHLSKRIDVLKSTISYLENQQV